MTGGTEYLNAFEPNGQLIGPRPRAEVHRQGLWHEVFHCLIVRPGAPPTVLLQRRRLAASHFPGKLDLSATGHIEANETVLDGVREIEEEIGLVVDPTRLTALGRRLMVDDSGGTLNREIVHVFLLEDHTPLSHFDLNDRDVAGLIELTLTDLHSLVFHGTSVRGRELDLRGAIADTSIAAVDLVPSIDGYWKVVAVMAQRFVDGETDLAI